MREMPGVHIDQNRCSHKSECAGMRLCRLARLTISTQDIQAAIRQIMTWAEEWDWKSIKSVSY